MKKELHLICNAHIDPVWQWDLHEGICETLSTFRTAARFCRDYDGFVFCHNESMLYEWVEKYEPELFAEIRGLVACGKWNIMGGWYLQPDCNMPSGEAIIRNIAQGRRYFYEKFGVTPQTAVNVDAFGFSRGLVQIMAKAGFTAHICCRPFRIQLKLPAEKFNWVGYDGSRILCARSTDGYSTDPGQAVKKLRKRADEMLRDGTSEEFCLWGIGDHGGGPSRADIVAINAMIPQLEAGGINAFHSTPDGFFGKLREQETGFVEYSGDLNPYATGCYTSQIRVKQAYRSLENNLFACEKTCAALTCSTGFAYPKKELEEAERDMLLIQFHDALPGTSVETAEESMLRTAAHGNEIISRINTAALFRLCENQPAAKDGEIPIMVYNPHPYAVEEDITCEFSLAEKHLDADYFTAVEVYRDQTPVPSQQERTLANIPFDWRKRIVFRAKLAPMAVTRFDCRFHTEPPETEIPQNFVIESDLMRVEINPETGLIDSCICGGVEYFTPGALSIGAYRDDANPWGTSMMQWVDRTGGFELLPDQDGARLSLQAAPLPSVRVIENGDVRCVVEAVFGYDSSRASVRYYISKLLPQIDLRIKLFNSNEKTMYKLEIPFPADSTVFGEDMLGEKPLATDGRENVSQKYIRISGKNEMRVYNRGTYGSSVRGGRLCLSLMRSPGYTAMQINDRPAMPDDRCADYADIGERETEFRLCFGNQELSAAAAAQIYNEQPAVFSFFPSENGTGKTPLCPLEITGSHAVLTSFTYDDGFRLRVFNSCNESESIRIASAVYGVDKTIAFNAFEMKTFILSDGELTECDLLPAYITEQKS